MDYVMRIEFDSEQSDDMQAMWDVIEAICPRFVDNVQIQVINGEGVEQ